MAAAGNGAPENVQAKLQEGRRVGFAVVVLLDSAALYVARQGQERTVRRVGGYLSCCRAHVERRVHLLGRPHLQVARF